MTPLTGIRHRHLHLRRPGHRGGRPRGHPVARPAREAQRHGPGLLVRPAPGHGRHRVGPRPPGGGGGRTRTPLLGRAGPGGHVRTHRGGRTPATVRPGRWPPGPGRPGPRSSASRPRSTPWPTARCRSSPPSTATASGAASTSSPPATSGWPARTPSSRCGRPRWPSSPTSGSLQRLPGIIGQGHVAELAFTGKDITAARAESIGLVNQVCPDAEAVRGRARALAAEIAANSPLAVQGTKAVLAAGAGPVGGRRTGVRGHLERRVPGLRRPDRGHVGLHREATGRVHRPIGTRSAGPPQRPPVGWLSAGGATSGGPGARCARPPCAPRPGCPGRRR